VICIVEFIFFYKGIFLGLFMKVELISTPNGIDTLEGAKKYCQDFARICYSEKGYGEVREEAYDSKLVDGRLINSGHHSVFDHFNMGFYFDGLPKAMAMVFNAEPPYTTSEKSARYTEMKNIPEGQKVLYDKWKGIFIEEIDKIFPEGKNRDIKINKLAQENARYVTSVFTPTKMGYTMSLRQMNILADEFEKFGDYSSGKFNGRLFQEGMKPYLESKVVKKFRIPGLVGKSENGLHLFGEKVEEFFGEDSYSTNLEMSFACLAQNHRHRTIHNHIWGGLEMGEPDDHFIPPIIEASSKNLWKDWLSDLASVAENDFPQAQIIQVAERGNREDLEMKLRERNCGLAQLEIVRLMDGLLESYSVEVPEMGELQGATCITSGDGCKKGGCTFGPEHAIDRLI
jgi:hypothetical protein